MSNMDPEERIARLEATVQELDRRLAALTQSLEARREPGDSMRAQVRCPSCGGRRIVRAKRVADRDGGRQTPMAVSIRGLFFPEAHGIFACDVCAACGLVEWHVEDPAAIDMDHEDIEVIEVDDESSGPYR